MFTVQVAVVPLRVASADALSVKAIGLPPVRLSSTEAIAVQAILAVGAMVAFTVIVKLNTSFPANVVNVGGSASGSACRGRVWNTPVRGSRYPWIPRAAAAFCPHSDAFIPRKQANSKSVVDTL